MLLPSASQLENVTCSLPLQLCPRAVWLAVGSIGWETCSPRVLPAAVLGGGGSSSRVSMLPP